VAVLFADLRGFTSFSEGRLPYDTVFVLNRYFAVMGAAIEGAGGRVDKFIGDGIMALFGLGTAPDPAARAALAAARRMAEALDRLNLELAVELDEPLRMGIGLHLGHAIVGEMGHGRAVSLTAIGDTVNVASRLEMLTKELGCQLVVSDRLARRAGIDLVAFPLHEVDLRGRAGRFAVRLVADSHELPRPDPDGAAAGWWHRGLELLGAR
jgi:adenylate cyclase